MINKAVIFLCILLLSTVSICQARPADTISGEIITGYRVLPIDLKERDIQLTVYRGDYIKFSYPEQSAKLNFAMPELKYRDTVSANPDNSPYFKMKATGTYSFTLGDTSGKVTVVELDRPNYQAVSADEAAKLLKNLNPFILDVRTMQEYKQIHIENTHLIPIQQLQARMAELEAKKHEDIFIYCATGNRSTVASRILADSGFKRIYNLRYGIYDWAKAGYPYLTGQ